MPTYTFAASAEVGALPARDPGAGRRRPAHRERRPARPCTTRSTDETARDRGRPHRRPAGRPSRRPATSAGDIPIVEDAAHAFPSPIAAFDGRFAGTIGRAGAFSFYATKTITTGEGGMLATDDAALADRARTMRLHGIGRDAWKRYTAAGSWYYEIEAAGFKDNLTDLAAAIGLVQLERAAELRASRATIARAYLEGLAPLARAGRLVLPAGADDPAHAWHLFVIRLGPEAAWRRSRRSGPAGRRRSAPRAPGRSRHAGHARSTRWAAAGIGVSVHFIPLHLHPLYERMGYRPGQFPNAEAAYAGAISLPIWPGMTRNPDRAGRRGGDGRGLKGPLRLRSKYRLDRDEPMQVRPLRPVATGRRLWPARQPHRVVGVDPAVDHQLHRRDRAR